MKYRLKDRELQKKLDEISAGSFPFSEALDEECQEYFSSQKRQSLILVAFGQTPLNTHAFNASFHPNEVEKFKEYDPNAWNSYPDVKPPEGVWMRTEMHCSGDREGLDRKLGAIFLKGQWSNSDGDAYPKWYTVKRFRPWED